MLEGDRCSDASASPRQAAIVTLPTPDRGPPLDQDKDVARAAADVVKRLLHRETRVKINGVARELRPEHIGLAATHRARDPLS